MKLEMKFTAMTKLEYPTFEVVIWDESGEAVDTLIVRAAPFSKIGEVKDLQQKLIEAFEEKKGSLGELLADKTVYATMQKLASLLRVVGLKEPGLDISSLYDAGDIVQLGRIFFSESVKADMRSPGYTDVEIEGQKMKLYNKPEHRQNPIPSAIARIHDLPFFDLLMEIRQKIEDKENKRTEEQLNPVVTAA
jgi:hypothetical protein